jgi:hypothetical protein
LARDWIQLVPPALIDGPIGSPVTALNRRMLKLRKCPPNKYA